MFQSRERLLKKEERVESKSLTKLLAIFSIFCGLILVGGTLIWIFTGNSLFGWYPGSFIENIGNLILGIWALIIGYKYFISPLNQDNQWLNNLSLLFYGIKIIADETYHFFDGKPDTYSNPISIFFGFIFIGMQIHLLINRKQKNIEDLEKILIFPSLQTWERKHKNRLSCCF